MEHPIRGKTEPLSDIDLHHSFNLFKRFVMVWCVPDFILLTDDDSLWSGTIISRRGIHVFRVVTGWLSR